MTHGDAVGFDNGPEMRPAAHSRLSPQEQNNISSLRGRIEQVERELKHAAQTPGGIDTMRGLRERMKMIENDLEAAEDSTKEHFALEHLRARMEKVEKLLTEGERAAQDWEVLEELRAKIGNVDSDLKAVEEAKKEFEALELLRSKMEAVESELKVAEQLATDRENVDHLRQRLRHVESELGVAEPVRDDPASVDKLLDRLARAESSLQDARASTMMTDKPYFMTNSSGRGISKKVKDDEVEKILDRLTQAERKLNAAKASAQRRNPNTSSGYPNIPVAEKSVASNRPFTPFDERQAKIRARLQEHFEESSPETLKKEQPRPPKQDARPRSAGRGARSKFEEPRTLGGFSKERYYVQDVQLDREVIPRAATFENETIPTHDFSHRDEKYGATPRTLPHQSVEQKSSPSSVRRLSAATTRPLHRRYAVETPETEIRPSRSMPYSVLGDDEDRYTADLEELRYQRALLSQKLPRNRFDDEEKKSDDSSAAEEQKNSWKKAIREEEMQRLKGKLKKKPSKEMAPKGKQPTKVPEPVAKEPKEEPGDAEDVFDESQSKGGDPPMKSVFVATGDPPSQLPSLEKDLKSRLLAQPISSGRDPRSGSQDRASEDPPAHVDPPRSEVPATPFVGTNPNEHPSDEKSAEANQTEDDEYTSLYSRPDASVSTPATGVDETKQWWAESNALVPVPPAQEPPQKEVRQQRTQQEPPTRPPSPPPRSSQAPQPPSPSPAHDEEAVSLRQVPPTPAVVQAPAPPQQPIFHQTTVVDGKAAARERREKDRLMRWVVLILLCIAIVLAVVIIVVIVLLRDDNDTKSQPPTTPTAPTPAPDMIPTVSLTPSSQPSFDGSLSPTVFIGCPELENNRPLATDGVTTDQDTIGAFYDASVLGSCGAVQQAGDNGVWYALIGAGEVVTVSTCTLFFPAFDTQVLIYTPVNQTMGCRSGMNCVASNDNFCGLQSSATFIAQVDTLYFIYVNGLTDAPVIGMNATEGDFSLTVSKSPMGSCQGALPLEVAPAGLLPVIVVGSLIGGTFGVDPCNPEVESRTGELWYKVVGTGQVVVASTCHAVSSFEARLAVYRGDDCNDLLCITSEDEDCGNGGQISWFAERDVEYHLLVYSPDFVVDGSFGVTVQEIV